MNAEFPQAAAWSYHRSDNVLDLPPSDFFDEADTQPKLLLRHLEHVLIAPDLLAATFTVTPDSSRPYEIHLHEIPPNEPPKQFASAI